MSSDDIFIAMIKEEINQYSHMLLLNEEKWTENANYEKLASKSLKRARIIGGAIISLILIFSFLSIQQFIQYGTTGNTSHLSFGILAWGFVLISTIFYSRNIIQNKKSMERILKLLDARKKHY